MNSETFKDCWDWLCKYHGKQPSGKAYEVYRQSFVQVGDDLFCQAVKIACRKVAPGNFPSIEKLNRFVEEARVNGWERTKAKEPRRPLSQPPPDRDYRNTGKGARFLASLRAVYERQKTPQQMIADLVTAGDINEFEAVDIEQSWKRSIGEQESEIQSHPLTTYLTSVSVNPEWATKDYSARRMELHRQAAELLGIPET
jgi:hypothetical protein